MRGRFLFYVLLFALCAVVPCAGASAETWSVFNYHPGNPVAPGYPSEIAFAFDNVNLSLNGDTIHTIGGSSSCTWTLLFSGTWAVCGTIDGSGAYTADPYAQFIIQGQGGHIQWEASTPAGYIAPLILGGAFADDGSATYTDDPPGFFPHDVTATLALNTQPANWGPEYHRYDQESHTFYASYQSQDLVPEPSGLLAVLTGLITLSGCAVRSRRSGRSLR